MEQRSKARKKVERFGWSKNGVLAGQPYAAQRDHPTQYIFDTRPLVFHPADHTSWHGIQNQSGAGDQGGSRVANPKRRREGIASHAGVRAALYAGS